LEAVTDDFVVFDVVLVVLSFSLCFTVSMRDRRAVLVSTTFRFTASFADLGGVDGGDVVVVVAGAAEAVRLDRVTPIPYFFEGFSSPSLFAGLAGTLFLTPESIREDIRELALAVDVGVPVPEAREVAEDDVPLFVLIRDLDIDVSILRLVTRVSRFFVADSVSKLSFSCLPSEAGPFLSGFPVEIILWGSAVVVRLRSLSLLFLSPAGLLGSSFRISFSLSVISAVTVDVDSLRVVVEDIFARIPYLLLGTLE